MTKSRSEPISIREARAALKSDDTGRRDAVLGELDALAAAEITDVLSWDADGEVLAMLQMLLTKLVMMTLKFYT